MGKFGQHFLTVLRISVGAAVFALGFNLFLLPNALNAGGLSGLSMMIVHLTKFGSVGVFTAIMNLPLFALAGIKVGKRFVLLSVIGALLSSLFIDMFYMLPRPQTEPLIGSIYGGATCGLGLGIVFVAGGSTGGSDIVVRLLKKRWENVPIGTISIIFDMLIAVLTGIVFRDFSSTLYSGIAIFVCGQVVDAVVYRFDYSRVALIISKEHEAITKRIAADLGRGATYLHAEGSYSGTRMMVVLTAVKRQQLAELKALVADIDSDAFIIVQEAHQVLGDGFLRYSKDAL